MKGAHISLFLRLFADANRRRKSDMKNLGELLGYLFAPVKQRKRKSARNK
jgi:hypothetical protein